MVYLLEDGRQLADRSLIGEEKFIEIPDFILPERVGLKYKIVVGIEDSKPKYSYFDIPYEELTDMEKVLFSVSKSQDEIRQEGADSVMEEMKNRGLIV